MAIIRNPTAPPPVHGLGTGILMPKQRYHFQVLYDFDSKDSILTRQTVRVVPGLDTRALTIYIEDDRMNQVVKQLATFINQKVNITVQQLDGNNTVICDWSYEGTLIDFQFTELDYGSSDSVQLAVMIDVERWDVDPK